MMGNIFGVLIFTLLTVLRIQQALNGSWIAILLALQSGIAVALYFRRTEPQESTDRKTQALAWISALLPLAFSPRASTNPWLALLLIPGLSIALWAMIALDRSFSIAPAKREIVIRGPYKYMRHPMYGGEILSLVGVLIASFSLWNLSLFLLFLASVLWRIRVEESLLARDVLYAKSVPWLSLL
jgi:hypothetical protein